MQKGLCKILFILTAACSPAFAKGEALSKADLSVDLSSVALAKEEALAKADSLYSAKQYTQAFELYNALYQSGNYSPAMLLKMAYIHEGLGHLGESLFYLNLYYLASDDQQALKKMEEMAEKNHLEGYEVSETARAFAWLQEQYTSLALILASLNILLLALIFYQRKKKKTTPMFAATLLLLLTVILTIHVNFTKEARRGIVAQSQTYLMSGPSAGSSVVAIVGEGHQLTIQGQQDVWLKVSWKDQEVYVKEFLIRPVRL